MANYKLSDISNSIDGAISTRALCYMCDRGLIPSSVKKAKGKGNHRVFSQKDFNIAQVVCHLKLMGMDLQFIKDHLAKIKRQIANRTIVFETDHAKYTIYTEGCVKVQAESK